MPFSSEYLSGWNVTPGYQQALQAFEMGEYASAYVLFAEYVNTVGPAPAALTGLGEAAFMEQQVDEARRFLTMALDQPEVHPLIRAVCHFTLGNCSAACGQMPEAFEEYRRATALNPDYPQAWWTGGRCLLAQGRDAEAAEWFEKGGSPRWQGLAAAAAGQLDAALAALTRATEQHPDLPEAWLGRALVEHRLGREEAAMASARTLVGGGLIVEDFAMIDAGMRILNGAGDYEGGLDLLLGRGAPIDADPGLQAISAHLGALYPDQAPLALGQVARNSPIDAVWVYANRNHWHFVSLGFSELYAKESPDPNVSGWGFELSMRVARPPDEKDPPAWVAPLLFKLGRYVFNNKSPFDEGHHVDFGGPLDDADSPLTALAFAADPQLKPLDTPNGRVKFLATVGLKPDERPDLKDGAEELLAQMSRENPLLVVRG